MRYQPTIEGGSKIGLLLRVFAKIAFTTYLSSFLLLFRCSYTFPGARVPPATSRPGRRREFRHARCGSQTLAYGSPPVTVDCSSLLLLLRFQTEIRSSAYPFCS